MTFVDLPRRIKKILLSDPTMQSMDLFDHIIQNVDRNPRNILITMPSTATFEGDVTQMKMHLIDHSSCFGVGKLNAISIFANKLHSQHLAVVKFDPGHQARKFDHYLTKIPTTDLLLIRKTLKRFAAITDDQFDRHLFEVQELLTSSQYNRIRDVLCRQRDIARRYIKQRGTGLRPSSMNESDSNETASKMDSLVRYF